MSDSNLEIEVVRESETAATLRLHGELDLNTADRFRQAVKAVLDDGCRDVTLDMERLYLLDSAALGVLLNARQRAPGQVRLRNPSPAVRRVLDTTGASRLFAIQDAEEGQQQILNFDIRIDDSEAGVPVVHVIGELDAFSVALFRGALISLTLEGHRFAVLHLERLAFVDSVGLGGMVSIYTRLKKNGGGLYLAAPSEQVAKVLRITGLDALFPIYPTCEAALAAARAAAALENAPG